MKITIKQLGGHYGSFAGDCAVIQIQSETGKHVVVIDTGDSTAVRLQAFQHMVNEACNEVKGGLSLITTHCHADHYNADKVHYVLNQHGGTWYHGDKLERGAWQDGGTFVWGSSASGSLQQPNILNGRDNSSGWVWMVDSWAPNWGGLGRTPSEENDLSLATAVYASNGVDGFSFVTLGDMTPDGAQRLPWPLFIADIAKFPHHGSEHNRIGFFSASVGGGVRDTVLISGDSGTAAPTVLWLYEQNPLVKARVLLRTDGAKTNFQGTWETLYKTKPAAKLVNLKAGQDVTITWSSTDHSQYTLTQTGEQTYHEVISTVTRRRTQTSMLWEYTT